MDCRVEEPKHKAGFLSEPRLPIPPLWNLWCCSTTKRRKITIAQKSVISQLHSDIHLLCVLLFLMPTDCGWPCLAPEELVCCHVCTPTGSKVGTEGPKIFDQWSKKKQNRESPLEEWLSSFLSVSLYLYQSLSLWWCMATGNTEYTES